MKLKKIASLALAGIMAVSMLAGCKDGGNSSSSSSEPTTPATGVSAEFASYLTGDRITFADNATYENYLVSGLKDADPKWDTLDAYTSVTDVTTYVVGKKVAEKFDANDVNYKTDAINWAGNTISTTDDGTYIAVYAAPGKLSEDVVLKDVAAQLDNSLLNSVLVNYYDNGNNTRYDYEYTGSVSMQKVEDGSASAWYVLVTVSIDVTEVKA